MTVEGRSHVATLVKAGAGVPYLAYYVVLPAGSVAPDPTVEVFHAGGDVMGQNLGG